MLTVKEQIIITCREAAATASNYCKNLIDVIEKAQISDRDCSPVSTALGPFLSVADVLTSFEEEADMNVLNWELFPCEFLYLYYLCIYVGRDLFTS